MKKRFLGYIYYAMFFAILFSVWFPPVVQAARAENGKEVHRAYESMKEEAVANQNTAYALAAEIKKVNAKLVKTSRTLDRLSGEISDLEERILAAEQKSIRLTEWQQEYVNVFLFHECMREKREAQEKKPLSVFFLEKVYSEYAEAIKGYSDAPEALDGQEKKILDYVEQKSEKEEAFVETEKKQLHAEKELLEISRLLKKAKKKAGNAESFAADLKKVMNQMEAEERAIFSEEMGEDSFDSADTGAGTDYYYVEQYDYTEAELLLMAGIIQAEAGSTSYPGMIAVGSVVMNRVEQEAFPNTIKAVVYAPYQFEPARTGRLALIMAQGPVKACMAAAKDVLEGKRNVPNLYFKADWYAKKHGIHGVNIGGNVFH